jgi:YesN/AraC family two-component response regulator
MTKHRFVLGFDKTIYDKYLDDNLSSNIRYPIELEDQIVSSIKLNRKDLFQGYINDLTELLKFYPYSEAVTFIFQIITTCIKTFNQVTIQDNQKYSIRLDEFSSILSKFQNLTQVSNWLLNVFEDYQQMIEGINQLKNNKHFDLINKVQDYIKDNYNNINLSADSISEVIGYSPYYFTKVFKEITGMNINDYIRQIRIDKVKELLSNTDYKINQIPNMAGFTNASHFFAVFKKDVGLTPLAYREYILDNKKGYLSRSNL